jgi:hypothetical protein
VAVPPSWVVVVALEGSPVAREIEVMPPSCVLEEVVDGSVVVGIEALRSALPAGAHDVHEHLV